MTYIADIAVFLPLFVIALRLTRPVRNDQGK